MHLASYIIRRLLQMIPVFIIVTVMIFLLIRAIPGDPARTMLGETATEEQIEAYRQKIGYYDPLWQQYLNFVRDLARGDLGDSLRYHEPVNDLLAERFPVTVSLTAAIVFFVVILGIPLGFIAGICKDRLPDQVIRFFALLGLSAPVFWVGLMLMLIFGVRLGWFPVSGWGTTIGDHIYALILPGFTQAFNVMAVIIRNLRNNVVDISRSSYVTFARSKGLSRRRIYYRYIFRNALLPTTTLLAMWIASLLGGCIVIESVFTLPGLGKLMIDSILSRDYAVVQGGVILFVVIVLVINLLTDIIYSILDPRVKLS